MLFTRNSTSLNHRHDVGRLDLEIWHLFSKHIGNNASDDEDNGEKKKHNEVGQHEALDLLPRGEAAKAGEYSEDNRDDENDVGGVHVQPAPQQLLEEGLVFEGPDCDGKKDDASDDSETRRKVESSSRGLLPVSHFHLLVIQASRFQLSHRLFFLPKHVINTRQEPPCHFAFVCLHVCIQTNQQRSP